MIRAPSGFPRPSKLGRRRFSVSLSAEFTKHGQARVKSSSSLQRRSYCGVFAYFCKPSAHAHTVQSRIETTGLDMLSLKIAPAALRLPEAGALPRRSASLQRALVSTRRLSAPIRAARSRAGRYLDSNSLLGSYLAGHVARSSRDSENAALYYRRALSKDPANQDILDDAFQLDLAAGEFDSARSSRPAPREASKATTPSPSSFSASMLTSTRTTRRPTKFPRMRSTAHPRTSRR